MIFLKIDDFEHWCNCLSVKSCIPHFELPSHICYVWIILLVLFFVHLCTNIALDLLLSNLLDSQHPFSVQLFISRKIFIVCVKVLVSYGNISLKHLATVAYFKLFLPVASLFVKQSLSYVMPMI